MRHAVRAADNGPDPCRGLAGYVTTYQALAAAPDLHLAEFQPTPLPAVRRRAAPPARPVRARRGRRRGRGHGLVAGPAAAARDRAAAPADDRHAGARRPPADPVAALPPRPPRQPRCAGSTSQRAGLGGGRLRPPGSAGRARDHPGPLRRARRRGRVAPGPASAARPLRSPTPATGCGRCCSRRCAPATPTTCCGAPCWTAAGTGTRRRGGFGLAPGDAAPGAGQAPGGGARPGHGAALRRYPAWLAGRLGSRGWRGAGDLRRARCGRADRPLPAAARARGPGHGRHGLRGHGRARGQATSPA